MAKLIRTDGSETEVAPLNGTDFKFVGEAYELIGTEMIEVVYLRDGRIMLIDEEGKLKGKPVNERATQLWSGRTFDVIVGTVLVCANSEVR